ncbi:MAG: hypothetical protein OXE82_07120 [Rhodobacter sp.]|nr:hypothetical protein [Rhodobacter sp.]
MMLFRSRRDGKDPLRLCCGKTDRFRHGWNRKDRFRLRACDVIGYGMGRKGSGFSGNA